MDEEAEHETMYNDYNQQIINIEQYVYKIDQKVTTQTKYREAACIKELTFTNNNIQPHFLSVFKQLYQIEAIQNVSIQKMLLVYLKRSRLDHSAFTRRTRRAVLEVRVVTDKVSLQADIHSEYQ